MHVLVKNSIFDGTLLENLPFEYRWYEDKPNNLYSVKKDKIVIKNHKSWYDIRYFNSKEWLQKMFIHDICHTILYAERGQKDHIFKDDFGLTWDDTEQVDQILYFTNFDDLMDEYKIVILGDLLEQLSSGKLKTKQETVTNVSRDLYYLVLKEESDLNEIKHESLRQDRLSKSYDYWISAKGSKLEGAIAKLREILAERGFR